MSSDANRYGRQQYKDAISELYDDDEKEAVFRSSMKKGGAVHEFNMSFKPPGPRLDESPDKSGTAFGGGMGKENKQPVVSGYKPHPRPEMAAAFRREVPTDFPR